MDVFDIAIGFVTIDGIDSGVDCFIFIFILLFTSWEEDKKDEEDIEVGVLCWF